MGNNYSSFNMKELLKKLRDEDEEVRLKAAWGMGSNPDPIFVEPLLMALEDKNIQVRRYAVMALYQYEDERIIEAAFNLLKDNDKYVRNIANKIVSKANSVPMTKILEALKDNDSYTKIVAMSLLCAEYDKHTTLDIFPKTSDFQSLDKNDSKYIIAILEDMTNDEDAIVRANAISCLGKLAINEPNLIDFLRKGLDDKSTLVCKEACQVLVKLKDRQAVDLLIKLLESDNKSKRWYAITALGKVGGEKALPALLQYQNMASVEEEEAVILAIERINSA